MILIPGVDLDSEKFQEKVILLTENERRGKAHAITWL